MDNNTNNAPTPAATPVPTGIVSVNDRGGAASGMLGKVIFLLAVAFVVIVGSIFFLNKFMAARKAAAQEVVSKKAEENKPAAVGGHRTFDTDPPLPSGAQSDKTALGTAAASTTPCPDGALGTELMGADGKPLKGPDGQSLRACRDGRVVTVPAVQANPFSNGSDKAIAVSSNQQPNSQQVSRYGGDVVIPNQTTQATLAQQASPSNQSANTAAMISAILGRPAPQQTAGLAGGSPTGSPAAPGAGGASTQAVSTAGATGNQQGSLGGLLGGTQTNRVTAGSIGDQNLLLPMGRFIDCALTIRMINEVSGMASCVLQSDVVSDNGRTILLEKGSEATGEYIAQMSVGQRRLFVLWNRIKTPYGVYVNVGSPGADGLGTTGLDGYVDNRWAERIGAAFMLSLVQDAIGYETAKASSSGGGSTGVVAFQNTNQTGSSIAQRVLESTINIKPTLYKNQGDRASIYVARDMDFGSVYALRAN
jgi:type IV secretion system protein VirB10